jgi:hypothetical protein
MWLMCTRPLETAHGVHVALGTTLRLLQQWGRRVLSTIRVSSLQRPADRQHLRQRLYL